MLVNRRRECLRSRVPDAISQLANPDDSTSQLSEFSQFRRGEQLPALRAIVRNLGSVNQNATTATGLPCPNFDGFDASHEQRDPGLLDGYSDYTFRLRTEIRAGSKPQFFLWCICCQTCYPELKG